MKNILLKSFAIMMLMSTQNTFAAQSNPTDDQKTSAAESDKKDPIVEFKTHLSSIEELISILRKEIQRKGIIVTDKILSLRGEERERFRQERKKLDQILCLIPDPYSLTPFENFDPVKPSKEFIQFLSEESKEEKAQEDPALQAQLMALRQENEKLRAQSAASGQKEAELMALRQETKRLQAELDKARKKLNKSRDELAAASQDVERLQAKLNKTKQKFNNSQTKLGESRQKVDELAAASQDVERLQAQLAASGQKEAELAERLRAQSAVSDQKDAELMASRQEIGRLQAQLYTESTALRQEIGRLQAQLAASGRKDAELMALKEDAERLQAQLAASRQQTEGLLAALKVVDRRPVGATSSEEHCKLEKNFEAGKGLSPSIFVRQREQNNSYANYEAERESLTLLKEPILGVRLAKRKNSLTGPEILYGWNGTNWCPFDISIAEKTAQLHEELNLYYARQGTNILIFNGTGYIIPE